MSDTINRFSDRVDNYIKFRPDYPAEVLDLLRHDCGLHPDSIIADIGSGTGKLSELFLKNGNRVIGIEPNAAMRAAAEKLLSHYSNFESRDGAAEQTGIDEESVDFVLAGQAFHWFDQAQTRVEFSRILKPNGWVVLVWNERRLDSTPFLRGYEEILLRYGTDYEQVRHENITGGLMQFFSPGELRTAKFDNVQVFNLEGLRGRVLSSSYAPGPEHPRFELMMNELARLFAEHSANGKVAFEYDTSIYYGQLPARRNSND